MDLQIVSSGGLATKPFKLQTRIKCEMCLNVKEICGQKFSRIN